MAPIETKEQRKELVELDTSLSVKTDALIEAQLLK